MQKVILSSSIPSGTEVCVGEEIVIQCTTIGTSILEWESDAYNIGPHTGNLAQVFYSVTEIGTVSYIGPGNISMQLLNSTQSDSDGIRLVSTLRLEASSAFPNPTLTCHHVAGNYSVNSSKSINFTVIGKNYCNDIIIIMIIL